MQFLQFWLLLLGIVCYNLTGKITKPHLEKLTRPQVIIFEFNSGALLLGLGNSIYYHAIGNAVNNTMNVTCIHADCEQWEGLMEHGQI